MYLFIDFIDNKCILKIYEDAYIYKSLQKLLYILYLFWMCYTLNLYKRGLRPRVSQNMLKRHLLY